jgi:hypothetical protein
MYICFAGIEITLSYSSLKSEKTILTLTDYIFLLIKKIGFFRESEYTSDEYFIISVISKIGVSCWER